MKPTGDGAVLISNAAILVRDNDWDDAAGMLNNSCMNLPIRLKQRGPILCHAFTINGFKRLVTNLLQSFLHTNKSKR
jgi:hypothetical protein